MIDWDPKGQAQSGLLSVNNLKVGVLISFFYQF